MRYLRKFNESTDKTIFELSIEIKEFCENYLVDLLDMGYEVSCHPYQLSGNSIHTAEKWIDVRIINTSSFKRWSDIKDYFIPFFIMLDESYQLKASRGRSVKTGLIRDNVVSLSGANKIMTEIEDDKVGDSQMVDRIEFTIVL
jgi:hypothetical protein